MKEKGKNWTVLIGIIVLTAVLPMIAMSAEYEPVLAFGSKGSGNGQFNSPISVVISNPGDIYVVDYANHRIQRFSNTGVYLSQFGTQGSGNGQLKFPSDMAIDSSWNIWIADSGNNRIQKFSSLGTYLSQFGTNGTGNGQFDNPLGIALDGYGNIWVADVGNNRIPISFGILLAIAVAQ